MAHWFDRAARRAADADSRRDPMMRAGESPRLDQLSRTVITPRISRRQALKVAGASAVVLGVSGGVRPGRAFADGCTGGCGSAVQCNTSDGDCICCDPMYFTTTPKCCSNFAPSVTAESPCCEQNQECCVNTITKIDGSMTVGNSCCDPTTQTCLPSSQQGCCDNAYVCGTDCCFSYETCVNGACCLGSQVCGSTCCPDGQNCCLQDTGHATCCDSDHNCVADGSCCPKAYHLCGIGSGEEVCCEYECVSASKQGPAKCCKQGDTPAQPRNTNGDLESGQVCCPPERLATFTGNQTCCPVGYVHQPGGGISVEGGPCCKATDICGKNCCPSRPEWPTVCVKGDCWAAGVYKKHLELTHANEVKVPVMCESCSGTATLQTSTASGSALTARARKPVVLGTAHFKTGRHKGTTTIKLSRSGQRYLAKHKGSITVQLKLHARAGGKTYNQLTQPATLALPKKK